MRIAVIGTSGQLGFDLARVLPQRHHEVAAFSGRAELDVCDAAAFAAMLDQRQPDAVINTAAFHNVDLCEKETEAAYRTNVVAVREMARLCEAKKVLFFQIGTDYVAEGWPANKPVPESAPVHPNSIYSLTRYGGDCMTLAHAPTMGYVVRSCGLFGVAGCKLKGGLNFVDTMIKMARDGKKLRVVDDQVVAPTPTDDLAVQLAVMAEEAHAGTIAQAGTALGTSGLARPLASVRLAPG
ncbi:MAG TPA: sugar nucleotide-binding protein, partial [Phycisphaerae bacterium]|nr:sugar nucleotide-binding protein [Phycisphaerae bacterium]